MASDSSRPHNVTLYFGEHWDAPRLGGATQVPTPVGEPCLWCEEAIEEGDWGFQQPHVNEPLIALTQDFPSTALRAVHRECDLRFMLGGLAHLNGKCECYGFNSDEYRDEDNSHLMTKREEAKAVWNLVSSRGAPG